MTTVATTTTMTMTVLMMMMVVVVVGVAMMAAKKKKKKKDKFGRDQWRYCEAKQILVKAVKDNTIQPHMGHEEVWDMYKDHPAFSWERIYGNYRFKERLKSLRDAVEEKVTAAASDAAALAHDRLEHPIPTHDHRGQPYWQTSVARDFLLKDIEDGLVGDDDAWPPDGYRPKKLWQYRPAYQQFTLATFRDHIHKELRRKKERARQWEKKQEEIGEDADDGEDEEEQQQQAAAVPQQEE